MHLLIKSALSISIHAPTRGATSEFNGKMSEMARFQSTLLQEERPSFRRISSLLLSISIHAPTRGATLIPSCLS